MTPSAVWNPGTARIGWQVLVYDEVDSTNNLAAALAVDPANDGIAVLASRQTAGRGQHGRTWQTPAGSAVLLSVLCFPPPALRRASVLTAWAAVSVCETVLEMAGTEPAIKWPNDVLAGGRKVCGILCEQARGTVVGIGLNVNQTAADFAQAELPDATSLRLLADRAFDRDEVARGLIGHLDREFTRLESGDLAMLEEKWRHRTGLVGRQVRVECARGVLRGQLLELTFEGVLLDLGGVPRLLAPEIVQHVTPEDERTGG
jgi:BirA family biotin operon repressor/biotin-[acetyl-CoA-carboxylase] ligase